MAIVQISQIQLRRGLQQDLPNLASGEMGWSVDTRRLFIGNGTLEEGAPDLGKTEILTEFSNFLGFISSYTFSGTDAGYTSQTGTSALTPVTRSLQSVLDETISVHDFGATGNGQTDDTAALTRAIQQVYPSTINGLYSNVQRIIKIPAGTYKITNTIRIPPNCTLVGEGKNNTIISATNGPVFALADSLYQIAGDIGTNGAFMPGSVAIKDLNLTMATGTSSVMTLDSITDIAVENVSLNAPGSVINLISVGASQSASSSITFSKCTFNGGTNGFGFLGFTNAIRITNSFFKNQTAYGISNNTYVTGLVSQNNYFDSSVATPVTGLTGNNYSFGDTTSTSHGGAYIGAAKYGVGQTVVLSTGSNTLRTLSNGAGQVNYEIVTSTQRRFGTFTYSRYSSTVSYDDEYNESGTTGAVMAMDSSGVLTCTVNSSSTIRFNITQFV